MSKTYLSLWGLGFLLICHAHSEPLSLKEIYEAALQKTERMALEDSRVDQKERRVSQAWAAVLPDLTFSGSYSRRDGGNGARDPNQTSLKISATQPLFRGLAEYAGLKGSHLDVEAQKQEREYAKMAVLSQVSEAYYNLLASETDLKNLETLVSLSSKRVGELAARHKIGRSRKGELLSAQAQLAALQAEYSLAKATHESNGAKFSSVTGLERNASIKTDIDLGSELRPLPMYVDRIIQRPDQRALDTQVKIAEEAVVIARAGHFPTMDATANYYIERKGSVDPSKWDVGVSFSLPLFQGGETQAKWNEAKAKVLEAKNRQWLAKRDLDAAIQALYESVSGGLSQIKFLQEAQSISEKNYEEQTKDYRFGLVTNLDVLQAMNALQENTRALDRVRFQTKNAWTQLDAAVGIFPGGMQ